MDLSPLEKLGRKVREASDEAANPSATIEAAKRGALADFRGKTRPSRRPAALVLAFAALLALALVWVFPRRPSITYVVGESAENGALGAWIASGASATELRFSEGSRLVLAPSARARVTHTDENGARVLLERGAAHARVTHASAATSWGVHAGPFEVAVVGTEFDVAWDPTHEVLVLGMIEGKVVVRGPLLGEGRTLAAGEELRVAVQDKRSEVRVVSAKEADHAQADVRPAEPAPPAVASTNPEPLPQKDTEQPSPNEGKPDGQAADEPRKTSPWRALAAEGRHREVMEAVEKEGFDHVLANSPADALIVLADEARFAGSHDRAEKALLRARELGARGRSAFLLGKLAADHRNAPAAAVTWFERYLAEEPSGGLAEQALGRIIELQRRNGNQAAARAAAERYLASYPRGAYAELARVVVGP